MYLETWWKCLCPRCSTVNWLCCGDSTDLTSYDPQALRCRKCKKISLINPFGDGDAEEADTGMKDPRNE